jgi:HK97 family phage major capsid protein
MGVLYMRTQAIGDLADLRARRVDAVAALSTIHEAAEREARVLTRAEAESFAEHRGRLQEIDRTIDATVTTIANTIDEPQAFRRLNGGGRLSDSLPADIAVGIERAGRVAFEWRGQLRTLARNTIGLTVPTDPTLIGPTAARLFAAPVASPLLIELLPTVPVTGSSITQNLIDYDPADTGNKAAVVPEAALKPESDVGVDSSVLPFATWAHHIGVTRQALSDLPALRQLLDVLLTRGLLRKVDTGVFTTLSTAATVFTPAAGSLVLDNAALAAATLQAKGGTNVTVALNPLDLVAADTAKTSGSGQYIGRPASINATLVACPTIPLNKLFAFASEGAYIAEREAVNVVAGIANDDFLKNIIRLLSEWRGVAVVQLPSLLLYGNASAAAAATLTKRS